MKRRDLLKLGVVATSAPGCATVLSAAAPVVPESVSALFTKLDAQLVQLDSVSVLSGLLDGVPNREKAHTAPWFQEGDALARRTLKAFLVANTFQSLTAEQWKQPLVTERLTSSMADLDEAMPHDRAPPADEATIADHDHPIRQAGVIGTPPGRQHHVGPDHRRRSQVDGAGVDERLLGETHDAARPERAERATGGGVGPDRPDGLGLPPAPLHERTPGQAEPMANTVRDGVDGWVAVDHFESSTSTQRVPE